VKREIARCPGNYLSELVEEVLKARAHEEVRHAVGEGVEAGAGIVI